MEITVSPELEELIEKAVASGRYDSASDVVSASLLQFQEDERWLAYAKEKIARGLADAAAGRMISSDDFLKELRGRSRMTA